MENRMRTIFDKRLYHIKVKPYMTRKSSANFDFMKKWNKDVPMPSDEMSGFKLRETNGMVFMELHMDVPPYQKWSGWIIKSAILEQQEQKIGMGQGAGGGGTQTKPHVTIRIQKAKGRWGMLVIPEKATGAFTEIMKKVYAKPTSPYPCYSVSVNYYEDLFEMLTEGHFPVDVENPDGYLRDEEFRYDIPAPETGYPEYVWKTEPRQYQVDAYHFGMARKKFLIADEMGTGKTKMSIDIAVAKKRQHGYPHCLVICGVNTLKWNWIYEIEKHSDEKGHVLGSHENKNGRRVVDGNRQKLADLKNINNIPEYFLVTNVESLQSAEIAGELRLLCEAGTIGMIIFDEFHKVKNTASKQGKNMMKISADCQIALTGTPILNSPVDLYALVCWLGFETHTLAAFKEYYTRRSSEYEKKRAGFRNMDKLKKNLKDIMLRRKKEDVLDLPDKVYLEEYLEMSKAQQAIYDEVQQDLREQVDEIEKCPNPLSRLIRLRQATAATDILSSKVKESVKLERLADLVAEAVDNGNKVLVFSNWAEVTSRAADVLREYSPLLITGDVSEEERMPIATEFQENPERRVIIGTVGAMGTGLTLTAGNVVIFLDEPWTNALKEQAIDRAHRIGTTDTVVVYTLMCRNTIDERIHFIVSRKRDVADCMVDDKKNYARFLLGLE